MAQVKIYGLSEFIYPLRERISNVLHTCLMDTLGLPAEKKIHRFICLERSTFFFPQDRSERYTIIEISMFEGRSIETKKRLYQLVFERFEAELAVKANDIEIIISETPRHNWGIRGENGDELELGYEVNV